jgi:hypothetical protein
VHNRVFVHPPRWARARGARPLHDAPPGELARLHFTPGSHEVVFVPKVGRFRSRPSLWPPPLRLPLDDFLDLGPAARRIAAHELRDRIVALLLKGHLATPPAPAEEEEAEPAPAPARTGDAGPRRGRRRGRRR